MPSIERLVAADEVELLGEAVRVARVVAGERGQRERGVRDRARDRPLEDERRRRRRTRSAAMTTGTRPNDALKP